jgi:hypothetical protein
MVTGKRQKQRQDKKTDTYPDAPRNAGTKLATRLQNKNKTYRHQPIEDRDLNSEGDILVDRETEHIRSTVEGIPIQMHAQIITSQLTILCHQFLLASTTN